MADLVVKQHDNWPALQVTLSDVNGAVNLTGCTVRLIMRTGATLIEGIMDPAANQSTTGKGQATYTWAAGDTSITGTYQAEFEVTFSNGKIETFPNTGYKQVVIEPDLG